MLFLFQMQSVIGRQSAFGAYSHVSLSQYLPLQDFYFISDSRCLFELKNFHITIHIVFQLLELFAELRLNSLLLILLAVIGVAMSP
jgi:hypothetical protein